MKTGAQSTIEFVILVCFVVGALVAIQIYLKRGIQGKIKATSEQIGGELSYSPGATIGNSTVTRNIDETTNSYKQNGDSIYEGTTNMNQVTNRSEEVFPIADEPQR